MEQRDWVRGDLQGLEIPAHPGALQEGGAAYLTAAFHKTGSLPADNRVTRITRMQRVEGGSTGVKCLLDVDYERAMPTLQRELFVKFSRDFDHPARDRGRVQMAREARFALLSRSPGFPIAVPDCYCADYAASCGTGMLVTRRIHYGAGGVHAHYPKCLDYELGDALPFYRALVLSLARLAAFSHTDQAPASLDIEFPFDRAQLTVGQQSALTQDELAARLERYAAFAGRLPNMVPAHLRHPAFTARLRAEAPRFLSLMHGTDGILSAGQEMIALCHWNANIDNAWFWPDASGELQCGLLDWGNVSRMNLGMGLWGCLSGAELSLWDEHLADLLEAFCCEYHRGGGPVVNPAELERHMTLYALGMGLQWLLDVPAFLQKSLPGLPVDADRRHPDIAGNETARVRLQMMTVFLNRWYHSDIDPLFA